MAPIFKSLTILGALAATSIAAPLQQLAPRSTNSCTKGTPCKGEVTFYDTATSAGAPSACGTINDGGSESVLALPVGLMSDADCGKTVTVRYGSTTQTGKVVDKCMGCQGGSIDLSKHFFSQLAAFIEGRLFGVEWFIDE